MTVSKLGGSTYKGKKKEWENRVGRTGKRQGWIWKRRNGRVPKMVEEPLILAIADSIFKLLHKWSLAYNTEIIHNKLHILDNGPIHQYSK